jgi:SAM-dependent methyltransferase
MNSEMPQRFSLQQEILQYYENGQEAGRLESPFCRWEKIRTLDLLERFLPPAPAVILDVGGGAGAYAFTLAENGYIVDLIDPVPLHIDQAKKLAPLCRLAPRSFQVGDARAIPCDAGTADAVLLFGPLYHLSDSRERLNALREAHRVLHAGGILLAVAISRFASALDGIGRGLIRDPKFVQIMEQDLKSGRHRNETGNLDYFTTAFFHHPDEFKAELVEAGFPNARLCAIEGPLWTVHEPSSDAERDALMAVMRTLESDASLIGASAHIMGIATK